MPLGQYIIWTIYYIVWYLVICNLMLFTCLHHVFSKLILIRLFFQFLFLLLCVIRKTLLILFLFLHHILNQYSISEYTVSALHVN